jgi:hypothetical protein
MKKTLERNEGKHARQNDPFVTVVNKEAPTKAEIRATRRKIRFMLVESIRMLVITLFLFAVQSWGGVFFPLVCLLIVTGLLSVLEYEADDLE